MTTIISDRYALRGGQATKETVERRLHEERFVKRLVTGLNPRGQWTDNSGRQTTLELWCFEQHQAARRAEPVIDAYLKTGQNLAPHIIETGALDAQFDVPGAREAWGTPAHMVWFLANTPVERIIEHFREVGVPGVSVSASNALIYQGEETRTKPATMEPIPGMAATVVTLPNGKTVESPQRQMTERYRDWAADDMPLADDVILLGDDGTGADIIAQQEHALLEMVEEQTRSEDAAKRAKAQAKKDRIVADATERHKERVAS